MLVGIYHLSELVILLMTIAKHLILKLDLWLSKLVRILIVQWCFWCRTIKINIKNYKELNNNKSALPKSTGNHRFNSNSSWHLLLSLQISHCPYDSGVVKLPIWVFRIFFLTIVMILCIHLKLLLLCHPCKHIIMVRTHVTFHSPLLFIQSSHLWFSYYLSISCLIDLFLVRWTTVISILIWHISFLLQLV